VIIEFKHLLIRQNTAIASLTGDSDRAGGCTTHTRKAPAHESDCLLSRFASLRLGRACRAVWVVKLEKRQLH
jgi:hypothetical protein